MTVVFTAGARNDLDEIVAYSKQHFPHQLPSLEDRLSGVMARIERHPKNAVATESHRDVRVVPLTPFPFRIFYREIPAGVEILYIRHAARKLP